MVATGFEPGKKSWPYFHEEFFSKKNIGDIKKICLNMIIENKWIVDSNTENHIKAHTKGSLLNNTWGAIIYIEFEPTSKKKSMFYSEKIDGYNVQITTYAGINPSSVSFAKGIKSEIVDYIKSRL